MVNTYIENITAIWFMFQMAVIVSKFLLTFFLFPITLYGFKYSSAYECIY